jgi:hypothetical protein
MFWLLFGFWINTSFEIIISTNSHTRHINLSNQKKYKWFTILSKKSSILGIRNMAPLPCYVFRMVLPINDLCGWHAMRFLWCIKWICILYLEKKNHCIRWVWRFPEPPDSKLRSWVLLNSEPKINVLARTSIIVIFLPRFVRVLKLGLLFDERRGWLLLVTPRLLEVTSAGIHSQIGPFLHRQTKYLPIKAYISS